MEQLGREARDLGEAVVAMPGAQGPLLAAPSCSPLCRARLVDA